MIDDKGDGEGDGGGDRWSSAVRWLENGREDKGSLLEKVELSTAFVAIVRVGFGLKMSAMGKGVNLCTRPC